MIDPNVLYAGAAVGALVAIGAGLRFIRWIDNAPMTAETIGPDPVTISGIDFEMASAVPLEHHHYWCPYRATPADDGLFYVWLGPMKTDWGFNERLNAVAQADAMNRKEQRGPYRPNAPFDAITSWSIGSGVEGVVPPDQIVGSPEWIEAGRRDGTLIAKEGGSFDRANYGDGFSQIADRSQIEDIDLGNGRRFLKLGTYPAPTRGRIASMSQEASDKIMADYGKPQSMDWLEGVRAEVGDGEVSICAPTPENDANRIYPHPAVGPGLQGFDRRQAVEKPARLADGYSEGSGVFASRADQMTPDYSQARMRAGTWGGREGPEADRLNACYYYVGPPDSPYDMTLWFGNSLDALNVKLVRHYRRRSTAVAAAKRMNDREGRIAPAPFVRRTISG